jgi:hypothetical protein
MGKVIFAVGAVAATIAGIVVAKRVKATKQGTVSTGSNDEGVYADYDKNAIYMRCDKSTGQWYQVDSPQAGGFIYSGGCFYEVEDNQMIFIGIGRNATYYGELLNGKPTGYGTLKIMSHTWAEIYDGDWNDGRFHGKGTLTWCGDSHSSEYKGSFKNGKRHGYGKQSGYGKTLRGRWNNGKFVGKV